MIMSGKIDVRADAEPRFLPTGGERRIWRRALLWCAACWLAAQCVLGQSAPRAWAQDAEVGAQSQAAAPPEGSVAALKAKQSRKMIIPTDPVELFLAGGFSMWPLLGVSIVSLWVALERFVALRRRRVIPR